MMEKNLNIKFENPIKVSLSPLKTPEQKRKEFERNLKETKQKMDDAFTDVGEDIHVFLASGKSFNQYTRDRMSTSFESKKSASKRVLSRLNKEKSGYKPKKHHGKFDNYKFDKDLFLQEIQQNPAGSTINWSLLARKYDIKSKNGTTPKNAGQVLKEYAKTKNPNLTQHLRLRRIRRAKKIIIQKNIKISLPTKRPAKNLKTDIKRKVSSGELYIGVPVAPKSIVKTKITDAGTLNQEKEQIYGRKIPMQHIRKSALEHQIQSGTLRFFTDEEYINISDQELRSRFLRIQESIPENRENAISFLKSLERTRSIKLWHDHSDILNHSYVCFMLSWLYDTANYLTNQEYMEKYPERRPINVQAEVEKPKIYIFGQSGCKDEEQMTYVETRLEDLKDIDTPIEHDNYKIQDCLRLFSGDGPARQFEGGQQRGGNYPCLCGVHAEEHTNLLHCFQVSPQDLDDRCRLATSSNSLRKLKEGCLNPFQNLKKR
ncbi:Hypothetical predicted protein [Mytilus galloprovincialis]|uniref:Uncharacterized protein n=1 Tax=Mytilus galloprovincialis TaxID=29158 RepID=A0A8B6EHD3_MYTGA|nr:Hypothetical predicted protein [Mytilus galloprovincialis]